MSNLSVELSADPPIQARPLWAKRDGGAAEDQR